VEMIQWFVCPTS